MRLGGGIRRCGKIVRVNSIYGAALGSRYSAANRHWCPKVVETSSATNRLS
jgi:hypothetical protein